MGERFELPAELNIYGALETRDALLAWVSEQSAKGRDFLEVSARDVSEVDGSGLQLLASLSNGDISWRLVEASEVLEDACRIMGLSAWLDSVRQKNSAEGKV
jgi:ABC-type transporter Mla MlaB component